MGERANSLFQFRGFDDFERVSEADDEAGDASEIVDLTAEEHATFRLSKTPVPRANMADRAVHGRLREDLDLIGAGYCRDRIEHHLERIDIGWASEGLVKRDR